MTERSREEEQVRMIEYFLGLLPAEERDQFAASLTQDSDLSARYEALVDPVSRLDEYGVHAPDDLAERILSAVAAPTWAAPAKQTADLADRRPERWRIPSVLRDLVAASESGRSGGGQFAVRLTHSYRMIHRIPPAGLSC